MLFTLGRTPREIRAEWDKTCSAVSLFCLFVCLSCAENRWFSFPIPHPFQLNSFPIKLSLVISDNLSCPIFSFSVFHCVRSIIFFITAVLSSVTAVVLSLFHFASSYERGMLIILRRNVFQDFQKWDFTFKNMSRKNAEQWKIGVD